jgi:S1-C subfamily serine protease
VGKVALNRTVQIRVYDTQEGNVGGSGVIISKGKVVTANHVVSERGRAIIAVKQSGEKAGCRIIRQDSKRDLALLQCDGFNKYRDIRVCQVSSVRIGTTVAVAGAPSVLPIIMTSGIVSGEFDTWGKVIIDAMIGPGMSGGPVFTLDGELYGIAQALFSMPPLVGITTSNLQLRRFLNGH